MTQPSSITTTTSTTTTTTTRITDTAVAGIGPAPPARPPGLMVMALRAAEHPVLVVTGEADLHTAGQLRSRLIEMLPAPPLSVRVDLGGLEFCDLAGLDALHDATRAAHAAGVDLSFSGMSAQLSWLHRTFPPRNPIPPLGRTSAAQRPARSADLTDAGSFADLAAVATRNT